MYLWTRKEVIKFWKPSGSALAEICALRTYYLIFIILFHMC